MARTGPIGREIYKDIPAEDVPPKIEQMLLAYLANRRDDEETFREFTRRFAVEDLLRLFEPSTVIAA